MNNINGSTLVIEVNLAKKLGLNQAIVIQQIRYWCSINESYHRNCKDGYYWTFNSIKEWQKQFPFWSESTVKRIFYDLENKGILIAANYNKLNYDRTKWYRVNEDLLLTYD